MKKNFSKTIVDKIRHFEYADILFSCVLLCLGIFLILFSDAAIRIIFTIGGVLVCLLALYRFLLLFSTHERSLAFYLTFLAYLLVLFCGLAMIFFSRQMLSLIGLLVGLYLLFSNAYKLYCLLLHAERDRGFWISLTLTSIALLLGLFLIFSPRAIAGLISVILGVALVYEAVCDIVFTLSERRGKGRDDSYVEVKFRDKTKRK